MALQLIPKRRALLNPSLVHLYSTAADPDKRDDRSRSSFASYFDDVKSSLRQPQSSSAHRLRRSPATSPSSLDPPPNDSLGQVRQTLFAFRRRVADSSPPPDDSNPPAENGAAAGGRISLGSVRDSLGKIRPQSPAADSYSSPLAAFRKSLKMRQSDSYSSPLPRSRGPANLPTSVFGREMREREEGSSGDGASAATKTAFVRMYGYEELGGKLRELRPEGKTQEEGWFSIEELSGRLEKLREIESKEHNSAIGPSYRPLRECLVSLSQSEEKTNRNSCK